MSTIPPGGADPLVATSFADWLTKTVGVLTRGWQPLLAIELCAYLPFVLLDAGPPAPGVGRGGFASFTGGVGTVGELAAGIAADLLAVGASVYVIGKQAAGQPVDAGATLIFAARRALPLLGCTVLALAATAIGLLLVLPGLYLVVVLGALIGVVMFERTRLRRPFTLVRAMFWQTVGRVLTLLLVAIVYGTLVRWVVVGLTGSTGFFPALLAYVLMLPLRLWAIGCMVVNYATLRHRENPVVTSRLLAAELDRP